MNRCFAYSLMVLFLSTAIRSQSAEPGLSSARLDAICKSVVRITSIPDARPEHDARPESGREELHGFGSGFVIARPSDGKRIIITAAHVLKDASFVTALLPGSSEGIHCDLIDVNDAVDLMALMPQEPISTPPLEISHGTLQRGNYVCLFGLPWGIDVVQDKGEFKGEWTAAKVNEQFPSKANSVRIPRGQTRLIVYNSPNAPGKSGGPLVDQDGRVVGVDNSRLPEGSGECLAISIKELEKLNLNSTPDPTFKKAVAMFHMPLRPAVETLSTHTWLKSSNAGKERAHFLRIADVPREAKDVVRDFFQQPVSFRRDLGFDNLQAILDKSPLERIVSLDFGFEVLLPKGFSSVSEVTKCPSGVRLTVKSDDPAIAAPYGSCSVQAFTVPDLLVRVARDAIKDQFDAEAYRALAKRENGWFLQVQYRHALLADKVAGLLGPAFPIEYMDLRVRAPNGGSVLARHDKGEVFRLEDLQEGPRSTPWFRENLISESSDLCYAVHGLVLGGAAVVTYYPFRKSDLDRVRNSETPSRLYLENVLMRTSLAFL